MNDPMSEVNTMTTQTEAPALPVKATWARVIIDQRKIELVALGLMIFSLWFRQFGNWTLPLCLAGGILLGLLNHLATEHQLLKVIVNSRDTGEAPSRGEMTRTTILRLSLLAVVAVAATAAFWHDGNGLGVLFGLAIFRLIALVMTTIPLLKELKNQ
jgi:hypothetical protein